MAKEIAAKGGRAHAAAIDTLDDAGVNHYIDCIVKQTGKIDIIVDVAGPLAKEYGNGKLAVDLPIDQFMVPLQCSRRWSSHVLSPPAPLSGTWSSSTPG